MNNNLTNLFHKILSIFRHGIETGTDVSHYIDSIFLSQSLEELEAVLKDDDNCEREPLLELIFFPEEPFRLQIEPVLEAGVFVKADEIMLSKALNAENIFVPIRFPDGGKIEIAMTEEIAMRFVSRLNISHNMSDDLKEVIDGSLEEQLQYVIKVRLRNARLSYNDNNVRILSSLFEKFGLESEQISEYLEVILNIISEPYAEDDIRKILEKRKDFYFMALQKAELLEEQFSKNNMETLMVQGFRSPHIDRRKITRLITILERLMYVI